MRKTQTFTTRTQRGGQNRPPDDPNMMDLRPSTDAPDGATDDDRGADVPQQPTVHNRDRNTKKGQ